MIKSSDKQLLNMMILEILQRYTDREHRLQQNEIIDLLDKNYNVACSRKTLYNNLQALREAGYDISTNGRLGGTCLLTRDLDDAELYLLIESVLFSRTMSQKQAKTLICKLEGMASQHFHKNVAHVCSLPDLQHTDNEQVMENVDVISTAITRRKKIRFLYMTYGIDFRPHPKREKPDVVNPYQVVANNGHFYLIGNYDKYDNVCHLRIDRMTQVEEVGKPVKPMKKVSGLENGLSLPKHMAEHLYMFSGPSVHVVMEAPVTMMDELIDWFGKDFRIINKADDRMEIRVTVNEEAMFYWALQYGPFVEVKSPEKLRDEIRDAVNEMAAKYSGEKGAKRVGNADEQFIQSP